MTLSNSPERTDDVELFLKKYMPWVSQAILLERQLQRRFGDLPFIYEKRIALDYMENRAASLQSDVLLFCL